ncbi:HD domain-containing protein [Acidovorax sp. CCYZU-2555]|uniref:HD domain-containing protein n=1 Tax=Acidovorax sp. CCYZU-2555 TaxID=2835042 RepID=UPI001BCE7F02|nr:HD domain-containing protein [Acidovorax sp. CCYZU-2555]MBS7781465.1 HD domain-containing protein [Acidovorax sp. CCYZU-2555]
MTIAPAASPETDLNAFAPYAALAAQLLPHAIDAGTSDGAHDAAHLQRVWRSVQALQAVEGGDLEALLAATLLHDCVNVEKNSPLRAQASRLSAQKAGEVLAGLGWPQARIDVAAHAIEAHSHSAAIAPRSIEARILQDADRLDAIGLIGAARCFYVGGRLGRALYDPADARAAQRPLDDTRYTLDHFQTKLLRLAEGFQTAEGTRRAAQRQQRLRDFYDAFLSELEDG